MAAAGAMGWRVSRSSVATDGRPALLGCVRGFHGGRRLPQAADIGQTCTGRDIDRMPFPPDR